MPLVISTGAGSASRNAIGTGVAGGMFAATSLGIFLIPVFYVVVRRIFKAKVQHAPNPGFALSGSGKSKRYEQDCFFEYLKSRHRLPFCSRVLRLRTRVVSAWRLHDDAQVRAADGAGQRFLAERFRRRTAATNTAAADIDWREFLR